MKSRSPAVLIFLALVLAAVVPAVLADDQNPTVIYQTTFSTDPKWETNNPSSDYWDSSLGMYHFAIEPSTQGYAYIPVEYDRGPFTMEYDVIFNQLDSDAMFRFGFSGAEMDQNKGPMVLTKFTNAKFGQIMWLRVVTPGNKMVEVNSQKGDTLSSPPPNYYDGPTVKYEINKTYHVVVDYDAANEILTMKVSEKTSGKDIWSYFINTDEDLHGMNRLYLGSKGDYGMMGIYAKGYIDNVRLTVPVTAAVTVPTTAETLSITTNPTPIPTPIKTIGTIATSAIDETPESPLPAAVPVAAVGIAGAFGYIVRSLKRRN